MFLKLTLFCCLVAAATSYRSYLDLHLPKSLTQGRIVGGVEAYQGEFPHQVSLQRGNGSYLSHFCGGSIILEYWILTAANCLFDVSPNTPLYVKAGKHSLHVIEKNEQVRKVLKYFIHEKYQGAVGPYDIALLRLEKRLLYGAGVQPIGLEIRESEVTGDVVFSGWGSISSNGELMPEFLQKTKLSIVNVDICKKAIEALNSSAPVESSNICTGPLTGGTSACIGDAGGPLIEVDKYGQIKLIGVGSWGIVPCGTKGAPTVYTKVFAHINWILNTMASCDPCV